VAALNPVQMDRTFVGSEDEAAAEKTLNTRTAHESLLARIRHFGNAS